MKITPQQTIPERIAVIEAALERVLDRDPAAMHVVQGGVPGTLFVWVRGDQPAEYEGFSLHDLAREIELELS